MRKSEIVAVPEWGGRDEGKLFKITEWDAFRAEKWAWRMGLALKGTNGELPDAIARLGMVGIAVRTINAILSADVDPAKIVRDPSVRDPATGQPLAVDLVGQDDIEEIRTVGWLRSEVLRIHTNFSATAALSALISVIRESVS
jgi:hypothetical protein